MSATVIPLEPDSITETVDFLRRLSGMMAGGRNAEMLLQAAGMIAALTRRAVTAEQLLDQQQDETARILALREVAEMAADNLITEVEFLTAQLADSVWRAEAERTQFAVEALRLQDVADEAEAHRAEVQAELAELRATFDALGDSMVMVPVETLRVAHAQFDHLAESFARGGDIISQTICEIGTCTIAQALSRGQPATQMQGPDIRSQ